MMQFLRYVAVLGAIVLLFACGGGDSTTTTVSGSGLNNLGQSPAVTTNPVQTDNNLLVSVSDGPNGFQISPNANILYATVTVCSSTDTRNCVNIDHVQVDTGSVGLRVLASKVKSLNLQPVDISSPTQVLHAWECFPFVIGGLWGPTAKAVVGLGRQTTGEVAIHLIEDETDPTKALQPPADCDKAADGKILNNAGSLGSNGILGIGSTNLDCGGVCLDGSYAGFVQYYGCPPGTTDSGQGTTHFDSCSTPKNPAKVDANLQVSNPISAFVDSRFSNGVVLVMPAVGDPGAASASGELIFGVDTVAGGAALSNNRRPTGANKVFLGVDWTNQNAYLNITTRLTLGGIVQTFDSSYLDTGTNGLFFSDSSKSPVTPCPTPDGIPVWYCPKSLMTLDAMLSDGGGTFQNQVGVQFQLANAEALFSTSNTAFSGAAGTAPFGSTTFAWGMPFFYGKRVYMSIWEIDKPLLQITDPNTGLITYEVVNPPWYAWTTL